MKRDRLLASLLCGVLFTSGYAMARFAVAADAPAAEMKDKENDKKEEHEDKIAVDQLPAAVVDAVKQAMPDGKITEAQKEKKDDAVVYELDVKSGDKVYEVKVSEAGKVLSQKIDEEDKKDEKDKKDKKD